jgi:biopolymer transport protein ExbD
MILRFRRARRWESVELNITAFMNLMVALVPFLLITLVFTQMAVQELNLPAAAETRPDTPPEQPVTVTVRRNALTVGDAGGAIRTLPATAEGYDLRALAELLAQVKQRRPSEDRIALLLEPEVSYDSLIQVMDAARYVPDTDPPQDMFTQVSIGDAP